MTVKGTVFTVSWDAATEKFELKLRHGRVTVSGPVTGGEIALRAGQRLLVDLPRGETVISEQKPEESLDAERPPRRVATAPRSGRPAATSRAVDGSRRPRGRPDGDRRWARGAGGRASRPHPRRGRARRS